MTHSDDDGLVLPPKLAPIQVVIVPIPKPTPEIVEAGDKLLKSLKSKGIRAKFDTDDSKRHGFKFAEYEMITKEKSSIALEGIETYIEDLLVEIQSSLFTKAKAYRDAHITKVDTFEEFKNVLETKTGFISAHWDGTGETEDKIKELTKATIRCIPLDNPLEDGVCILTGKPSTQRVLFAKAY
jgi:prolyl-tRNA synthetase